MHAAQGFEVETSVVAAADDPLRPFYTAPRDVEVHGLIKLVFRARHASAVLGMHAVLSRR